jgi:type II secretory pathway pseudopilin PulG
MIRFKITNLKDREAGLTIVELLIVIAVVVFLGYIVIANYSAIQSKQRNATRQSDLKVLQQQIETYFSKNGYYPNLNDINDASWRTKNMKQLNNDDLVDPLSKCNPNNNSCLGGLDNGVKKQYEYYATESDGKTSCNGKVGGNADQDCAQYRLLATYEGKVNGAKTEVLQNRD